MTTMDSARSRDPRPAATTTKALPQHVPVLVVGAGPAGLVAAISLARQGVEVLLVDRRGKPPSLPRATHVSLRSMELFRTWGLEAAIRSGGVEVEWQGWRCETLAEAGGGTPFETGIPSRAQSAMISPALPACVPQDHLERVLREHLGTFASATVVLGAELIGLKDTDHGVHVRLWTADDRPPQLVHARYLVAGDGAHSAIRRTLRIPTSPPIGSAHRLVVVFDAPLWELLGERRHGIYAIAQPEAAGALLPAGNADRWVYAAPRDPAQDADARIEDVVRRLRLATGVSRLAPEVVSIATATYAAQVAERFRRRDVFLVGDAAHRLTPQGGTGMNMAISGARDLGWKLGWVLRGWAAPELLDSYEAEHRPIALEAAARSAGERGWERDLTWALHRDLRGRVAHAWMPGVEHSTLDSIGPGVTLFADASATTWREAAAELDEPLPVRAPLVDRHVALALGIPEHGAILVRPDGRTVAAWSLPGSAPRLRDAIAVLCAARPIPSRAHSPGRFESSCRSHPLAESGVSPGPRSARPGAPLRAPGSPTGRAQ